MAITSGSFNSPGTPDKHVIPSRAQGPSATGSYNNQAAAAAPSSDADMDAENIYGDPGDGTRMGRREGLVQEALDATPNGISGDDNASEGFFDGSTFGQPSRPAGVTKAADVPGSPGFPGGDEWNVDAKVIPPTPPINATKAVTAVSTKSNNPAVPGSPGFPGLP